jgi:hypothetical protein
MRAENTYLKDGMDFISVHSLSETITDPLAALIWTFALHPDDEN